MLLNGENGAPGLNAHPLAARGSKLGLVHAVSQLLEAMSGVQESSHSWKIASQLSVQVNFYFYELSTFANITVKGLTVSGKNGANGPTATPLARAVGNPEPEPARLPCSEATTVLATKLRRLHALSLLINHLAKTPSVQVNFDAILHHQEQ